MSSAKTIILKGLGIRKEAAASGAVTPGHLVEKISTGAVKAHATAGGNAQKAFAVENDLIGATIDTDYASASRVQYNVMTRGEEVNALLANGQTVVIGDPLESAGDGTLQKHTPDTESLGADSSANLTTIYSDQIVGYAMEAVDMSDSSAADPSARIAIEIA